MSTLSTSESRARLGYLISEMLSLPNLPEDLHQAISAHLQQHLALVNLLKPEFCLRLYPVLAELADLEALSEVNSGGTSSPDITSDINLSEFIDDSAHAETTSEMIGEIATEQTDGSANSTEEETNDESESESTQMEGMAQAAQSSDSPRTLW